MVYYTHKLSTEEVIFEFVKVNSDLFYYYRIYNIYHPEQIYAFIYHPIHGQFCILEYDYLIHDFDNEVKKYFFDNITMDEDDQYIEENIDFNEEDDEEDDEDEDEEDEEDDEEDEDPMYHICPMFVKTYSEMEYENKYSNIIKYIHISTYLKRDLNDYVKECEIMIPFVKQSVLHFYKNVYIGILNVNLNALHNVEKRKEWLVHYTKSASFLIKIDNNVFQLDYHYNHDNEKVSIQSSPIHIQI